MKKPRAIISLSTVTFSEHDFDMGSQSGIAISIGKGENRFRNAIRFRKGIKDLTAEDRQMAYEQLVAWMQWKRLNT